MRFQMDNKLISKSSISRSDIVKNIANDLLLKLKDKALFKYRTFPINEKN